MEQKSIEWKREPNSALRELALLVGEWETIGIHPAFPDKVKGRSSFEWLEQEALLVWHSHWEQPGPPSAVSVIGHDDSEKGYVLLYSDERGVARIYHMSMEGGVWEMHRDSPDFSQRMRGAFSDHGNMLTVHGELMRDGIHWEGDLDVIYSKVR